jgi:hypothetical protein
MNYIVNKKGTDPLFDRDGFHESALVDLFTGHHQKGRF